MKKKVLWTIVIISALVMDHYTTRYITGTKEVKTETVSVDTTQVTSIAVDTAKKEVAKTTSVTVK